MPAEVVVMPSVPELAVLEGVGCALATELVAVEFVPPAPTAEPLGVVPALLVVEGAVVVSPDVAVVVVLAEVPTPLVAGSAVAGSSPAHP